jgi:hypothetical protein
MNVFNFLKDKKGSLNIFAIFFVMAIVMVLIYFTIYFTINIQSNAIVNEIEQKLNNSASLVDKQYYNLSETDDIGYASEKYKPGEPVSDDIKNSFMNEFNKGFSFKNDKYELLNPTVTLYYSTEEDFAMLYEFKATLKINVMIFTAISEQGTFTIEKDVVINGRHNFSNR